LILGGAAVHHCDKCRILSTGFSPQKAGSPKFPLTSN
jgi:hypothetical protein